VASSKPSRNKRGLPGASKASQWEQKRIEREQARKQKFLDTQQSLSDPSPATQTETAERTPHQRELRSRLSIVTDSYITKHSLQLQVPQQSKLYKRLLISLNFIDSRQGKTQTMSFQLFLTRHGIYPNQPDAALQRIMRTRSFKMDFSVFLKDPATRQDEFDKAYTFIDFLDLLDTDVKTNVSYKAEFTNVASRRGLTDPSDPAAPPPPPPGPQPQPSPQPSATDPGDTGTQQPAPTTDQGSQNQDGSTTAPSGQGGETPTEVPHPDTNQPPPNPTSEDPNETSMPGRPPGQNQAGSDSGSTSQPTETPEQRYKRFEASESTDYDPRTPRHANGTPFTAHEVEKEIEGFKKRFEFNPGSLNPNTILPTRRSVQGEIDEIKRAYIALHIRLPDLNLESTYRENAIALHHTLEGTHGAQSMTRSQRIKQAHLLFTRVEAFEEILVYYGGSPPQIQYD
jgi:hypothetical protein